MKNNSKGSRIVSHEDKKYVIQDYSSLRLVFKAADGELFVVEPEDLREAGWPCSDDGIEFELIGYVNTV